MTQYFFILRSKKLCSFLSYGIIAFSLFVVSFIVTSRVDAETNQQKTNTPVKKIDTASNTLKKSKNKSNKLKQNALFYEKKLFNLSREIHSTERKINKLTTKLTKLNKQKKQLQKKTEQQKDALAQQMQALYTAGKQSHLRLLLKQDDPSDISRTVKYFDYLNQHRLKRIRQIQKRLDKIKTIQVEIRKDTQELSKLQNKQGGRKLSLNQIVKKKDKAYKKQNKIVKSQEKKLSKLLKEESQLKTVIQQLAAIRQQEASKILKEKEREKKQKKLEKIAKQKTSQKKLRKNTTKKKEATKRYYVPNKAFSSLKGKLAWPVRGRISNRFGARKNSKQSWKGVLISAPGGTNVHAVARGKVEFSGRLNGYGYLIIIRHDKNYRSLYAHNRSVFKKEGSIVKAGEVIAAVGNSGNHRNTGLYFEIRRGTSHQNPAKWCR